MSATVPWTWLGRVDYRTGTAYQQALRDRLLGGDDSAAGLVLLEHDPVITLGRHADERNLLVDRAALAERGVELSRADRGGDVTYHGPGQLMVYPVVRLERGVVAFLAALAGALAQVAAELGVPGARWQRDPAGLWLGTAKLAACGIHVRRRVCTHGFAFNVSTPADPWRLIVPCGLSGYAITSIAQERARQGLSPPPPVAEVAALAAPHLCTALAGRSSS
jgi:lipoyl(octanoyl) transferase